MLSKKIAKYIQSLSHKKFRDEHKAFIAEGPKVVVELLSSGTFICEIICAGKEWFQNNEELLKVTKAERFETDEDSLKKVSQLKTPNKVVAVFNQLSHDLNIDFHEKLTLLLDDISDPGNLGTIIRIADWFAVDNIICSENCVDYYNPKVVQSTMGSIVRVNVMYAHLFSFINLHADVPVYAASLSGTPVSEFRNVEEGFLLIGNESKGISNELLDISKNRVTIPRYGGAESLNAAVATAIILSHIKAS